MIGNLRPATDAELIRLLANPSEITRFLYGAGSENRDRVCLDRAWHAIHFVLNGSRLEGEEPLNFLVAEGTPVGDVDVGYGPARVLSSVQVKVLASALDPVEPETFALRVDPRQLDEAEIYPGAWQRDGRGPEYVVEHYRQLRDLVLRLARDGLGLVLYIN